MFYVQYNISFYNIFIRRYKFPILVTFAETWYSFKAERNCKELIKKIENTSIISIVWLSIIFYQFSLIYFCCMSLRYRISEWKHANLI